MAEEGIGLTVSRHPLGEIMGWEEVEGRWAPTSIGEAADNVLTLARRAMELSQVCESPIEIMLGAEILLRLGKGFVERKLKLVPQYKLDPYRFDFAVISGDKVLLFIECDGKDFHSSQEQIDRDLRKEQWANLHRRAPVLRFSGSQINGDPISCVKSIAQWLQELLG